jgi:F420-non-reducing hydrogenase small subunit
VPKPKAAFYWCASCGGCEEAVIDLAEDFLSVVDAFDFVFWPVAMDYKLKDVELLGDGEITVSFINGGIRTSEQDYHAKLLRQKSSLVIAFGSCAHLGGVPGLANLMKRDDIFSYVYHNSPTVVNPEKKEPRERTKINRETLRLPKFYDTLRSLDQVINVDYYLPGCAPPPDIIMRTIEGILSGNLPPKGAVLAPDKALCDSCRRKGTRPLKSAIREIRRVHEILLDPALCFLDQGIICLGPATRDGCGERCINANMPCRGCFGPTGGVQDQGARFLSALASVIDASDEQEIKKITESIVDPAGTFYFYSLPSSMLKRKRDV